MPQNRAAWLVAKHAPLKVGEAPDPEPGPGEIVIRSRAVAINPVDWIKAYIGDAMFPWIKYPFVLGIDLSGDVEAVGAGVDEVKPGDRVLAMAAGMIKSRARAAEGAFQDYVIVLPRLTTVIPDALSYEAAAVVPLGLTTAAAGLFQRDLLGLAPPSLDAPDRAEWVLVWGGATSVGCNAIQLARAAGYRVATTASPKNFDYLRGLGADEAFDYRSPTVAAELAAALQGRTVMGALAIGAGAARTCLEVLAACGGRRFVANAAAPVSFSSLEGARPSLPTLARMGAGMLAGRFAEGRAARRLKGTIRFYDSGSVVDNEIGPLIYRDFLGPALATGRFVPAPPAKVVGHGLDAVQAAFDMQRAGVSATKIVVTLGEKAPA